MSLKWIVLAMLAFTAANVFAAVTPQGVAKIAADELVAQWKFDESSGTMAADVKGKSNGTLVKMTDAAWAPGFKGNALDFSTQKDSAMVTVADNPTIKMDTTGMTVSCLIKVDPALDQQLFTKGHSAFDTSKTPKWYGIWWGSEIKGRQIRFTIDDNGGQKKAAFTDKTGIAGKVQVGYNLPASITADQWIHFVGVRDLKEDSVKIYINGMRVAALKDCATRIGSDLPLIIGNSTVQTNKLKGKIDELCLYNYTMTAAQVKTLYDSYGLTGVEKGKALQLDVYVLGQNYPNPFNPETQIEFTLYKPQHALIKVYNTNGQEVVTLADQKFEKGTHRIAFRPNLLPSGVYFYKIESGEFVQIKKMTLLK